MPLFLILILITACKTSSPPAPVPDDDGGPLASFREITDETECAALDAAIEVYEECAIVRRLPSAEHPDGAPHCVCVRA